MTTIEQEILEARKAALCRGVSPSVIRLSDPDLERLSEWIIGDVHYRKTFFPDNPIPTVRQLVDKLKTGGIKIFGLEIVPADVAHPFAL